jgi:hypothetical protein
MAMETIVGENREDITSKIYPALSWETYGHRKQKHARDCYQPTTPAISVSYFFHRYASPHRPLNLFQL